MGLTSCEDPIDQVVDEISDLLMIHSYSEVSPVPGADLPSSKKHCQLGVESLQSFLEGLVPEKEVTAEALEQLRSIYNPFIRYCPLRVELANKLEECAERVMSFERFDSEPAKVSSTQACSLEESEWWGSWV